jgi:saccharopepsin
MEAAAMWRFRCGIQAISMCIPALLLVISFSPATALQSGSVKGELFHRSHPSSRLQLPNLGHVEKIQTDFRRSVERVQSLVNSTTPMNASTTWESVVTDAAPGEYVMNISLGTPAQQFVAVADTGSDLTWLQCKPCTTCIEQPDTIYDPTLSSTYKNLTCDSVAASKFYEQWPSVFIHVP